MMIDKLKLCPFCGGTVSIALMGREDNYEIADWWTVTRTGDDTCKCRVFMESEKFCYRRTKGESEKKALIEAWNRRAKDGSGERNEI